MIKPTLSIIIPVFNAEKYLCRCIDSIINQTYSFEELILVDDGSIDKSGAICDDYVKKDNRIKVFHNNNCGASAARNFGLAHATGDYISFIDADDWMEPNFYSDFFGSDDFLYDIYFQNYVCHKANGITEFKDINPYSIKNGDTHEVILYLMKEVKFGWSWIKLFKRSILIDYDIRFAEDIALREDELFAFQYCKHIKSICVRSQANYHYYIYSNSLTRRFKDPVEFVRISKLLMEESSYIQAEGIREYEETYYLKNLYGAVIGIYAHGVLDNCSKNIRYDIIKTFLQYYHSHRYIKLHYKSFKSKCMYMLLWFSFSPKFIDFIMQKWFSISYQA